MTLTCVVSVYGKVSNENDATVLIVQLEVVLLTVHDAPYSCCQSTYSVSTGFFADQRVLRYDLHSRYSILRESIGFIGKGGEEGRGGGGRIHELHAYNSSRRKTVDHVSPRGWSTVSTGRRKGAIDWLPVANRSSSMILLLLAVVSPSVCVCVLHAFVVVVVAVSVSSSTFSIILWWCIELYIFFFFFHDGCVQKQKQIYTLYCTLYTFIDNDGDRADTAWLMPDV